MQPALSPEVFDQVNAQLGNLAKGLNAIGRAIVKSTAQRTEPASAAAPQVDLGPYLEGLNQAIASLPASSGGGAVHVMQSLQPGVHDLLDEMNTSIDTGLLEFTRSLSRRLKKTSESQDKHLNAMINRLLKNFDMLKDLVQALRKIDTTDYSTIQEAAKDKA